MPLWRILVHPDTFTPSQRAALDQDITKFMVSRGLPAFCVNVLFILLESDNFYIGGVPRNNLLRFAIEQIARQMPPTDTEMDKKYRPFWMDLINHVCSARFNSSP